MSGYVKRFSGREFGKKALKAVRHLCLHNGWFKLLAILISLVLWAGLISQDESMTRDKTFSNVSVNITGADTMKRNGYIVVTDLSEAVSEVSAVAAVPQKQYEDAEASAYNIRLDLSRLNEPGEQEVKLLSSASATYGRVTSISPASIKVNVEEYIVRYRIPVSVTVTGETLPGWYMSQPTVDFPLVAVSGPRSLVNTISRARVFVNPEDIDWTEGTSVFTSRLALFNRSGEEVVSDLLEISYDGVRLDSLVLESTILPTRTFEIADVVQVENEVAPGYEIVDTHVSPETITVAARQEVLDQISELTLVDHFVDVKDLTETTTFQMKLVKPSEDAVLSNDTVTVTVEIAPIVEE